MQRRIPALEEEVRDMKRHAEADSRRIPANASVADALIVANQQIAIDCTRSC